MDDTDLGTLTREGDRWMLTFTRRLAHPREKVWRAVTEPAHLAAWYPQEIVGERRAGAPLRFVSPAGDGFDGQMLVFDPPEIIEFTWGADRLRIELRADGAGTLLTLTDTFDELGKAARDGAGLARVPGACQRARRHAAAALGRALGRGPPSLPDPPRPRRRDHRPAPRLGRHPSWVVPPCRARHSLTSTMI